LNISSRESGFHSDPTRKQEYNSWSLGARAELGAEWFVTSYLSFLGEYSLDATYDRFTDKRTSIYQAGNLVTTSSTESTTDAFRVSSGYAHLAVSLYF